MPLDSRSITSRDATALARFLAKHELPLLHRVPFLGRMLLDDMRRIEQGQPAKYIAFPNQRLIRQSEKRSGCADTISHTVRNSLRGLKLGIA